MKERRRNSGDDDLGICRERISENSVQLFLGGRSEQEEWSFRHNNACGGSCKQENLKGKAGTGFDSLPLDILVQIVCNVSHDELKPLSKVSSRFREAVVRARQMHFDYTTPGRARGPKQGANSLKSNESSERSEGLECVISPSKRPATPNAPKQEGKFRKLQLPSEVIKELGILLFPADAL